MLRYLIYCTNETHYILDGRPAEAQQNRIIIFKDKKL